MVEGVGGQSLQHRRRGPIRIFIGVQLDDLIGGQTQPLAQHLKGQDRRICLQRGQLWAEQGAGIKPQGRLLSL